MQKDSYINKLESMKETQSREMAYLHASNSDLADQNKKLANNLQSTREVYEKVKGETEDFMNILHGREKDQTEYEDALRQELEYLKSELDQRDKTILEMALGKKELTDQVEDAQRQYIREKQARSEVEKSLRERIQELELELPQVMKDADGLRSERHGILDSEPENRVEQEQTIVKAKVEKFENLVCGMRDGVDEKEQRGRQETRRWAEIVAELKQENMYLERKLEHLNTQLQAKVDYESSYKERMKNTREELRRVKEEKESEIAELKKQALEAEVNMNNNKSEAASNSQSVRTLRQRFENPQREWECA